jgi:hypothetical protein
LVFARTVSLNPAGRALQESMGDFHVLSCDAEKRVVHAAFTVRRGKRIACLEGELFNAEGRPAAQAKSTGMLVPYTSN